MMQSHHYTGKWLGSNGNRWAGMAFQPGLSHLQVGDQKQYKIQSANINLYHSLFDDYPRT